MKIVGLITTALPIQEGVSKNNRAWRKREYIVEYEHGQYPKSVVFSVMGQKIDELNIQQGAEYELELDFEAREWNGRYFLQASCWKATPIQQGAQPAPQPFAQPQYAPPAQMQPGSDNLPF